MSNEGSIEWVVNMAVNEGYLLISRNAIKVRYDGVGGREQYYYIFFRILLVKKLWWMIVPMESGGGQIRVG